MGIADHRRHALAEDMDPAWLLPDPVDDSEDEAQATAGLAQCNSLLAMSGTKPRKKKRPVLLLDPEEAAKALSQMTLTAAQDFADPERAAMRQPTLGLSAADECDELADTAEPGEGWREWAERGPTPLSTLPVEREEAEPKEASVPAPKEAPAKAASPVATSKPTKPTNAPAPDTNRKATTVAAPTIAAPRKETPRLAAVPDSFEASKAPAPAPHANRFVEIPFEEEPVAEAPKAAPRLTVVPEPERSAARRKLQTRPIAGDGGAPSFASLLARLRAAIERITTRR